MKLPTKMKVGLVLEGGAMRGLYTVGVLDAFMDNKIDFNYLIGVSAGACNGASYVSNQKGRGYRVNTDYLDDKRYISLSNYIKTKSIFGMDFIFDEIPNKLDPFDYGEFLKSDCEFVVGVTNVETGETVYFNKNEIQNDCILLRASSSIPVFAPMVSYKEKLYLDGGTSDPIPARKALEDGCEKIIVVRTRDRNFVRSPEKFQNIYKRIYKKYPKMVELLDNRHKIYNETQSYINKLEVEGKALIIAPTMPIKVGRFEKQKSKLNEIYELGINDTVDKLEVIRDFIGG